MTHKVFQKPNRDRGDTQYIDAIKSVKDYHETIQNTLKTIEFLLATEDCDRANFAKRNHIPDGVWFDLKLTNMTALFRSIGTEADQIPAKAITSPLTGSG